MSCHKCGDHCCCPSPKRRPAAPGATGSTGGTGGTGGTGATGATGAAGEGIIVANLAALVALPLDTLQHCVTVRVESLECTEFLLDPGSTAIIDNITVLPTSTGVGRWMRLSDHNPAYTEQAAWFVDPVNGSDENQGDTPATAIQHLAEFFRRVVRFKIAPTAYYTIQLLGDIPETDVFRPTGEVDTGDSDGNVFPFTIQGQRTVVFSGVSGAGSAITVPATNTQARFDGGVGFAPAAHLGRMVFIPATGVLAWITRDLGGGVAQVSEFVTVNPNIFPTPAVVLSAAPAAGSAYQIIDMTKFGPEVSSMGSPIIRYRFVDVDFVTTAAAESLTIKSVAMSVITSRIQRRAAWLAGNGTYFASGIDFPGLTVLAHGGASAPTYSESGLRNVELVAFGAAQVSLQNSHIEGGFIRTGITSQASPAFGGAFGAGNQSTGDFVIRGARGAGVFNAPVGRSGVMLRRYGSITVLAPLYGQGNALFGADVAEAGKMGVLNTIVPTITGGSGDVQLEFQVNHFQQLELHSGAMAAAVTVPLSSWAAHWAAPVVLNVSGFGRNVVGFRSAAAIFNLSPT